MGIFDHIPSLGWFSIVMLRLIGIFYSLCFEKRTSSIAEHVAPIYEK